MDDSEILILENALTSDEISQILNRADLSFKKASITTVPNDTSGKLSNHRRVWTAGFSDAYLTEKLNALFIEASTKFNISFDSSLTDLAIMLYKSDDYGHYGWHIDTFDTDQFGKNRKLSMSIVLDENYTGGSLCFENKKFENLSAGTCIIFSSSLKHCVEPVTSGIRHSLVSWAYEKTVDY